MQGRLYWDANLKISGSMTPPVPYERPRHYIGRSAALGQQLSGVFDELRIWNVARTKPELKSMLFSQPNPSLSSLVAAYAFDEVCFIAHRGHLINTPQLAGNLIYDYSSNNRSAVTGLDCESQACRIRLQDNKVVCGDGVRTGNEVSFLRCLQDL